MNRSVATFRQKWKQLSLISRLPLPRNIISIPTSLPMICSGWSSFGFVHCVLTPNCVERRVAALRGRELSPVCAIVGGILAQQIIKVVTGKDEPFTNFFFYNALDSTGNVEELRPSV
jgi:hypothetical protein